MDASVSYVSNVTRSQQKWKAAPSVRCPLSRQRVADAEFIGKKLWRQEKSVMDVACARDGLSPTSGLTIFGEELLSHFRRRFVDELCNLFGNEWDWPSRHTPALQNQT